MSKSLVLAALAGFLALSDPAGGQNCTFTAPGAQNAQIIDPCPPPAPQAAKTCTGTRPTGLNEAEWVPGDDPDARLRRITLDSPNTRCTDGTPAVIYVRPSTAPQNSPDRHRWVITFEGGDTAFDSSGTLTSGMQRRWDASHSKNGLLDCIQKMSTDFSDANYSPPVPGRDGILDIPTDIKVPGIFNPLTSPFSTWNWLFLNYCSSDHYAGTVGPVDLFDVSFDLAGNTARQDGVRVYYEGHNIVEAALQEVKQVGFKDLDSGGEIWMEGLETATTILVAGTSAGSVGVLHNLDYIRFEFVPADVIGAFGASHAPRAGVSTDSWFLDINPEDGESDWRVGAETQWEQMVQIGAFVDQSCEQSIPSGEEWKCLLLSSAETSLATRHLVRQDMTDPLKVGTGTPWAGEAVAFGEGIIEDYEAWDGLSAVRYFSPSFGSHDVLFKPEFGSEEMIACNQLVSPSVQQGPALNYADLLYDYALDSSGGARVHHDKQITFPYPAINVIWKSMTGGDVCN